MLLIELTGALILRVHEHSSRTDGVSSVGAPYKCFDEHGLAKPTLLF